MRTAHAWLLTAALVTALAGCDTTAKGTSGSAAEAPGPSRGATASTSFPAGAFADISGKPVSDEVAATFHAALRSMYELQGAQNGVPGRGGMSATVMSADGTWSGAVGKADGLRDVDIDSQFGIASVTKSVIAAQVMQMVEASELSLDDPATKHLPADFAFDTNGATIRQLLNMRSGIPDWFDDAMKERVEAARSRVWTLDEVLAFVGPARHPAGGEFEYADTNYNLLGLVIEHVRQRPLIQVLREGALDVPGTDRLIYQPDEVPTEPMAMPRGESRDALRKGGGFLPAISDASSAGAAGAMASDSPSLARWWRAFCGGEIVSQASLTEMSRFAGGANGYGLGLFNPVHDQGWTGIGHAGGNFGFASWAGCLPDDQLVVVVLAAGYYDDLGGMPIPLVTAARPK